MVDEINLKNVALSEEKTKYVETEIEKKIKDAAIRKFFTPEKYDSSIHGAIEFGKLGINSITNKEWFVDDKETGASYWSYKDLPWTYAVSIEEEEERMVIQSIIDSIPSENKIKLIEKENDENKRMLSREKINEFEKALEKSMLKVSDANIIITNVYDSDKFYHLPRDKFKHPGRTLKRGADLMGEFISNSGKTLPIYLGIRTPYWKTIIANTKEVGTFLIKEKNSKDLLVKVSTIKDNELEGIKANLGLTDKELDNRARVYIEEIITFKINNPQKSVLIENIRHEKLQ